MKTKIKKRKKSTHLFVIAGIIMVVILTVNIGLIQFLDVLLTIFMGASPSTMSVPAKVASVDFEYNKTTYQNREKMFSDESHYVEDVAANGIVLLENDDDYLPLKKGTKFSLFSHSSVDLIYGGTGSGSANSKSATSLKDSLENAGYEVNNQLWDFYSKGNGADYVRGPGSKNYGGAEDWSINECPLSEIKKDTDLIDTFSEYDTAVFVLSRTGGEGRDLARGMSNYTDIKEDKAKHYLEPDSVELKIVQYLNNNFDHVILLVNANNPVELGWVKDYQAIDAVLWAPGLGKTGANAIGKIFSGEVNPSGHLTDTFAYDCFSAPATQNIGDFEYTKDGKRTGYNYIAYVEGVYVGYRYYETRYYDKVVNQGNAGDYNYDETVLYPFGYGKSYSNFQWSDYSVTEKEDSFEVNVTVTNDAGSKYAGRDVVQIYLSAPYIPSGVEKAAVKLCGFEKTRILKPGESETVTISVDKSVLKSYDYQTEKTWIVDAGDYVLTATTDAHDAVKNVLTIQNKLDDGNKDMAWIYTQADKDITTYAKDDATGTEITNQLDHGNNDEITYLSRNDWENTYPQPFGEESSEDSEFSNRSGHIYMREATDDQLEAFVSKDSMAPEYKVDDVTYGKDSDLELIDLRGKTFDDPLWDELLDSMSVPETARLIALSGYGTPEMDSISKARDVNLDGPAGVSSVVNGEDAYESMMFFCEELLAQTWDTDFAKELGRYIGEESLFNKIRGWYAPAMNIHRSPFSGRNFEYYSEDGFISGKFAKETVVGAAEKGVVPMIKHFAVNDQENHRGGLITWTNEQAVRELYLVPFENCIKNSGNVTIDYYERTDNANNTSIELQQVEVPACRAVMSSYNRIGATWTGGNYQLLTKILREEWGFNGYVMTDAYAGEKIMDTVQMLKAGGDVKLGMIGRFGELGDSKELLMLSRNAAHRILYSIVNSSSMNGFIHGAVEKPGFPTYKRMLIILDVILSGIAIICIIVGIQRKRYYKKNKVEVTEN